MTGAHYGLSKSVPSVRPWIHTFIIFHRCKEQEENVRLNVNMVAERLGVRVAREDIQQIATYEGKYHVRMIHVPTIDLQITPKYQIGGSVCYFLLF